MLCGTSMTGLHSSLDMRLFHDARLRLFAGAVMISFSPVFVTLVSVSPTTSAFYRVLIGGVVLAVVWLIADRPGRLDRRALFALAAAASFFALDLWFWHRSIVYIGAGLSTLLANLQVFFMIGAGALLLREPPTRRQWLSAVVAIAGLAIMIGPAWSEPAPNYRLGVSLGVLTAASYTGYLLFLRSARARSRSRVPVREVAVVSLVTALLLGMSGLVEGESLAVSSVADIGWLAGYGLFSHALGVMLIASSLTRVSPTQTGIALLLQPALSFVWEVLFFGRIVSLLEASGAAVTLAAIYLGSLRHQSGR